MWKYVKYPLQITATLQTSNFKGIVQKRSSITHPYVVPNQRHKNNIYKSNSFFV